MDFNISSPDFDPTYYSTPLAGGTQTCTGKTVTQTYDIVNGNGVAQSTVPLPFIHRVN